MLLKLIYGDAQRKNGQWLENVDRTQLVLASDKLLLKNDDILDKNKTAIKMLLGIFVPIF